MMLSDERLAEIRAWCDATVAGPLRLTGVKVIPYMTDLLAEVDRLRARNAKALEVLRGLEWNAHGDVRDDLCPVCWAAPEEGHTPDCRLGAALKGASDAE